MKRVVALVLIPLLCAQSAFGFDDTFFDYQNYNHGYCPDCNYCPCRCDVNACSNSECGNGSPYPQAPPPCPPSQPCNAPAPCQTPCNPCDPAAPVCGTECGISICAVVVAIAALVAAGAIIIASSNGSSSS